MIPDLMSGGMDALIPPVALAGWGRFPVRPGRLVRHERLVLPDDGQRMLPRGLGRAYGDSAVPARPEDIVLDTTRADRVLAFDPSTGRLTCEAGLSLAEILRIFLPQGWFPAVTPGTALVTVGGCVASDVHGKNHHQAGSFGRFVDELEVLTAEGGPVRCGPDRERELFLATVGGMGLTGLITKVTIRLAPVETSWIVAETQGVADLAEMVGRLREGSARWPYTVGWIDGLARGTALGRGVLFCGRHARREEVARHVAPARPRVSIPCDAPGWLLNPAVITVFNALYRRLKGGRRRQNLVTCAEFFYPLDSIHDWNRLYGRHGFFQYQCVVPRGAGLEPVRELLERIGGAGAPSFLVVIKDLGSEAPFFLSFPMDGITLSLDLPNRGARTEELIHELNAVVAAAGGRIYLAKDAVTRGRDWAAMVPRLPEWLRARDRWDTKRRFRSAQSARLLEECP